MSTVNIGGSLLPSSSPPILTPLPFRNGSLIVRPLPDQDTHALFFIQGREEMFLASHLNGFSCRALAERIAGNRPNARAQADYIVSCGGKLNLDGKLLEAFL